MNAEPPKEQLLPWCPKCGFWKNTHAQIGVTCRRRGCDGVVIGVLYVREERP